MKHMGETEENTLIRNTLNELLRSEQFKDYQKPIELLLYYTDKGGIAAVNEFLDRIQRNRLEASDEHAIAAAYFPTKDHVMPVTVGCVTLGGALLMGTSTVLASHLNGPCNMEPMVAASSLSGFTSLM